MNAIENRPPARGNTGGRPPALDDTKKKLIAKLVRLGSSRRAAAKHVDCSPSTITRTARRDERFRHELEKAESDFELMLVGRIQQAASESRNWRAAAWLLERKLPNRYRPRRPDVVTPEQMEEMLTTLADFLTARVTDPRARAAVMEQVDVMVSRMTREARASQTDRTMLEEER